MFNATRETLTFTPDIGPVPNRGELQKDIFFPAIQYQQDIVEASTGAGIHTEPGFFLALPSTTAPSFPATIFRQGSIPHGTNILMSGSAITIHGPPTIPNITTRSIKPDGTFNSDNYLKNSGRQGVMPAGFNPGAATNPNLLLQADLAATQGTVLETTIITLGSGGNDGSGITNIPWLQPGAPGTLANPLNNAAAVQVNAMFWIEKIVCNGAVSYQLQYSQVVQLNFGNINWPHVAVATLIKQQPTVS